MDYNFREIEAKWQAWWESEQVYKVENKSDKPKYFVMDMFPYPSGAGLHVGHPLGYIATDVVSRFKRHDGFNVLHPMGFDAFGLPAEQYAVETGQHPAATTQKNLDTYVRQLRRIGFDYDWSREVKTTDPNFYRWTQWGFMQAFESWFDPAQNKAQAITDLIARFEQKGSDGLEEHHHNSATLAFSASDWAAMSPKEQQQTLMDYRMAYLDYSDVNWCPALGTVLANDEVKEGVSERGGHPVEKKRMRQWFLRTTAYAQRLLDGLETIDWSVSMKEMQRNWIGKSEGASCFFKLTASADESEQIEVFTTRPDTLFGSTFMVLAPEHDLVDKITTDGQRKAVEEYREYVQSRSERERMSEVKKVSGAFTGAYAINPFTEKEIPVWISEYVLAGYGTGAIMSVPSDDDRDHAFATHFELPIVEVVDKSAYKGAGRGDKVGKLINSGFLDGMEVAEAISAAISKLEEMKIGKGRINYRLRDAGFSRQRYWGEPFPVVYRDDMPYLVDESELPVELPEVSSYKPTGDGASPIAGVRDWVERVDGSLRETDTMPGYAGSSWYWLRYMDPTNADRFVSKEAEAYWQTVDLYIGGSEHAVGHLLYSRFWNKILFDRGYINADEPFSKLVNQGMIQGRSSLVYRIKDSNTFVSHGLRKEHKTTALHVDVSFVVNDVMDIEAFKAWRKEYADAEFILEDGKYICGSEVEKMSKRWYNVVNPDDICEQFGADTLRLYEMFMGPLEQAKPWDTKGMDGSHRFLKRFWRLFVDRDGNSLLSEEKGSDEELKSLHKAIAKVRDDINRLSLNTAVSAMMVCVNELTALNCHKRDILEQFTVLLSPFTPHIAEEAWQSLLGKTDSVVHAAYPVFNKDFVQEDTFEYPVSVNGKLRDKVALPLAYSKAEVETAVLEREAVQKWLGEKPPKKVIVVPGRIVNVVV